MKLSFAVEASRLRARVLASGTINIPVIEGTEGIAAAFLPFLHRTLADETAGSIATLGDTHLLISPLEPDAFSTIVSVFWQGWVAWPSP